MASVRWLCPSTLLLVAGALPAQFVNRAVWLGRDQEGMRRDYEQDAEYFVDRASYVDTPPWWWRRPDGGMQDPFGDGISVAAGSVTKDRLTAEAVADVGVDLGSGFTARLNYLQSEHQTTQFQRIAIGLDAALSDETALFVQLEGTPDKSRADVTLGVEFLRTDRSRHRLGVTLVDFAWRKSETFAYDRAPYAAMASGFAGDPESFEFVYEVGTQLPFEERGLVDGEVFRMNRTIWSAEGGLRLSERDRLLLGFDGELSVKQLSTVDPADSAAEDVDVDRERLRAEWWRTGSDGYEWSLGMSWMHLREDAELRNDPAGDAATRRTELMLSGRARIPLAGSWSLEPYVIGGDVRLERRFGDSPAASVRDDGFQGKLGVPALYEFSDRAWIRFDLSMQLDQLAFGGAGVQLVAFF